MPSLPPADHDPWRKRDRRRTEPSLARSAQDGDPLLRVRVRMLERNLSRSETLQGEVVVLTRGDGDAAEPRRAQLRDVARSGAEHAEVVEDLRQVADGVIGHDASIRRERGRRKGLTARASAR